MFRATRHRVCLGAAFTVLAVALLAVVPGIWAQDEVPDKERPTAKTDQEKTGQAESRPVKGRLPALYGRVVTEEQRGKIYGIQATYRPRIAPLAAELRRLRARQRQEIEAVLTPAQKEQLVALRSQAKERRRKAAARKEPTTTQ